MEMSPLRAALSFIVVTVSLSLAEEDSTFRTYAEHAFPNVDLPLRVTVQDGKVSIFADFDEADAKGVPIYLVNKSPTSISFGTEDGDLGIWLEARNGRGWARAQSHNSSWCGNSYGSQTLPSGMHFRVLGYRPAQGQQGTVRYSLATAAQQVVSNAGQGFYSPSDLENSRYDGESLSWVPYSLRDAFPDKGHGEKISPSVRAVCLDLLQAYGDVPALRRNAERQLQEWRTSRHLTTEEKAAMNAFAAILARPWDDERSPIRLLDRCTVLLKSKTEVAKLETNEVTPAALAWRVAAELATNGGYYQSQPPTASQQHGVLMAYWKEIVELAVTKIVNAPVQEAGNMEWLLRYTPLVDTFVTIDQLEPLLHGTAYGTARVAADALARRGKTERLAELAMELPASSQADVFAALAFGGGCVSIDDFNGMHGTRTPPKGSKEEAFWKKFTADHIDQVAFALMVPPPPLPPPPPSGIDDSQVASFSKRALGVDAFGPLVGESLRTYLRREADRSDASRDDFHLSKAADHINYSVEFLARSKRRTDIPLLRSLLRYRGYEAVEGVRSSKEAPHYKMQFFSVRDTVLKALKAMDQDIPRDVVLRRDVSDPNHIVETTNAPPTGKP